MYIYDQKQFIINKIAALRASCERNIEQDNVDNNSNPLDFLVDILQSLVGFGKLKEQVINFLVNNLSALEITFKFILKNILKKYFDCKEDSLIPDRFICGVGNETINIPLSGIDFFGLLKTELNSQQGDVLYGNPSLDLNAFLRFVIENGKADWQQLITVEYVENGDVDGNNINNILKVCIHQNFQGRTVREFINKFLDSVTFLQLPQIISRIFDYVFNLQVFAEDSVNNILGTGRDLLRYGLSDKDSIYNEELIYEMVYRILDIEDTVIDNSFFEFTNFNIDELVKQRTQVDDSSCCEIKPELNFNEFKLFIDEIKSNPINIIEVINNQISVLSEESLQSSGLDNNISSVHGRLIHGFFKALINVVFSPKVLFTINLYAKLVSNTIGFYNIEDFIKDFKNIFIDIVRDFIEKELLDFLVQIVIKELKQLISQAITKLVKEQVENYALTLRSLSGGIF